MLDGIQQAFFIYVCVCVYICAYFPPMLSGNLCVGVNELNCKIRASQMIKTFCLVFVVVVLSTINVFDKPFFFAI